MATEIIRKLKIKNRILTVLCILLIVGWFMWLIIG